jgi:DNA-binding PadR family transcriptional regulator
MAGARASPRVDGPRPESFLPLTPVLYHILISLADGDKHGYAVMRDVSERSDGRERILPGTLYTTIQRLLKWGWIERRRRRAVAAEDPRRRYYGLTPLGRAVAAAETRRLAALLRVARSKGFAVGR